MDLTTCNLNTNRKSKLLSPSKEEKINYIKQVLLAVHDSSRRAKNAKERRKQLLLLMKSGVAPTGPKVEWIKKTAKNIIKLIENHVEVFNISYGDDTITNEDISDLFAHLSEIIKNMID